MVEPASWWNRHLGGTGILVEPASWWNRHLGGTGILVEPASWWNRHFGGTGILVEPASWWNRHLAGYQYSQAGCPKPVELASCQLSSQAENEGEPAPEAPLATICKH
ncbi:MAG: hypothetical protein F6J90_31465 [Moorea sp. SIOASIH]|uniref:hypothetical protein n=1 Tax=Moorena sp. SIOASIH TaxID=2607817 RepID=UPI0013B7D7AB|nr:hypothetical protein [Moorena sp. SIOASIH]NEO40608.1 hypothetical protein [Moorena sp. SIOASIH]